MKKLSLTVLLSLLLLLAACGGPAAESPSPTPSETPVPTETATPEPTESVRPGLPWTPSDGTALSHDEYFAQTVSYTLEEVSVSLHREGQLVIPVGAGYTNYGVFRDGDKLQVWDAETESVLWTVAEIPGAWPVAGTTHWLYVVTDGKELVRMDYYGENQTTVFTDDSGRLGELQFNGDGSGWLFLLGEDLTYFLAGTDDGGVGIYRLYLPEDRVDLLYRYTPEQVEELTFATYNRSEREEPKVQISRPGPCFRQGLADNRSVRWQTMNPEFYALYGDMVADPETWERYLVWDDATELEQHIEVDFDMTHGTLYYADLGEDLLYTLPERWTAIYAGSGASPWGKCWFDDYLDSAHRQNLGLANMV